MARKICGLVTVAILAGCAGPLPIATRGDVNLISDNIASVRGQQSEQLSDIQSLRQEIRAMRGRIDELEYALRTELKQEVSRAIGEANTKRDAQFATLASRLPPPDFVPASFFSSDLEKVRNEANGATRDQLISAFSALKRDQSSESLSYFEQAGSKKTPATILAIVQFWTAFLNGHLGNHSSALQGWHQFVTSFPKHSRAPFALAQQYDSFEVLGDRDGAKITKQKLLAAYPKSPEALGLKNS